MSGDTFYAGFLIDPARANGDMTFELGLAGIDVGGLTDFSFGIIKGKYSVGSGGVNVGLEGGTTTAGEQRVVVRVVYGAEKDVAETVTLWVNPTDESSTPILDQLNTGHSESRRRKTPIHRHSRWRNGGLARHSSMTFGLERHLTRPFRNPGLS